jgi:AraC-like DNA-binding protein
MQQSQRHAVYQKIDSVAGRNMKPLKVFASDNKSVASPTLDQLAGAVCLSVNHFIRAFHQQTGVTPHRHVVLRRLERGITLLKKPGKSVAEVRRCRLRNVGALRRNIQADNGCNARRIPDCSPELIVGPGRRTVTASSMLHPPRDIG